MRIHGTRRQVSTIVLVSLILFTATPAPRAADVPTTNISGKVLDQDGVTPVRGVSIQLKDRSSDLIYQSDPSGDSGQYKISNVPDGDYSILVVTPEGTFELPNRLTIVGGKPSMITVILTAAASRASGGETAPEESDRRRMAVLVPIIGSVVVAAFAAREYFEKDGDGSPKLP